ncbi:MAG: glycosyl hydrolase [Calditrichaeota bacterium]|nr:MAG: glycosyl hydrolase [Calditrichota bacterium]MBL1207905.1 glycosyl hydrolase [Calditrichota bacterium]NOG47740.1 glycosyl hydrolase [Calditrichota bacterium]
MKRSIVLVLASLLFSNFLFALPPEDKSILNEQTFSGLKLRGIGPAFTSGRIADIAIHPDDPNLWYVAVGSGGVWKTRNAGTTWQPIFDDQPSYSIGCITIDPNNPSIIWVGTGENVGGRHVGYGDGVYRSLDGGGSWENMGLKKSEHISKIIVHPENSDIIWVAAQGPLWSKGDERGLYKSTDGGKKWKKVLGDAKWTGVTDILIDPDNPNRLYAATWQRHRNVAAYMGGGPESGIRSSNDGGDTWKKLGGGLPGGNLAKIGLAMSPQNPNVLYAAIELNRRKGAVYRSANRGLTWQKMSDTVSGGTGPHYYQELYASPHAFDRIYLADVRMQVSDDGGKTFRRMRERAKHSDNHAMAFSKTDPNWLLVGTDGGLYQSFDLAANWYFFPNLPVTQYYKVAVDDSEPFYNIYGGTQDNFSQGGPSRTLWANGIQNSDWFLTLGGDGHQSATEPGNPDIVYAESQEGFLSRIDRTNGETISIQPQPEAGQDYERFNWDSPILVSPHKPTRLYFASQRVWKSENRGDSWTAISGDLTLDQERINLPIMDKTWGWDAPWDYYAMSNYNTITSLAESPKQEGLIYAGTDDGLIQVTEDGGKNWRKINVSSLPGIPKTAFVNDIKADLFDVNTVYIALDNHKFGDFKPYLLKSTNRGKSWTSIVGDIPDRTLVWRVVQDHVKPNLLFTATEFGIYFTIDGGKKWIKLSGGVPTISFRDLAIQKRENDLVGASFGRGFYVFDDYSVLREVSEKELQKEAVIFPARKTWWYMQKGMRGFFSGNNYSAPNPPYGAVLTYYLKDALTTKKSERKKKEGKLKKDKKNLKFPGWDVLTAEKRQDAPQIWAIIKNSKGEVIRIFPAVNKKGFNRIVWDMRYPPTDAVNSLNDFNGGYTGAMVAPGTYSVTLAKMEDGVSAEIAGPMEFEIEQLAKGALTGSTPEEVSAFWQETERFNKSMTAARSVFTKALDRVKILQKVLSRLKLAPGNLDKQIHDLKQEMFEMEEELFGSTLKREVGEKNNPTMVSRHRVASGNWGTTYGPTQTQRRSLEIAAEEFQKLKIKLEKITSIDIPAFEKALKDAGAPYIDGQEIPEY